LHDCCCLLTIERVSRFTIFICKNHCIRRQTCQIGSYLLSLFVLVNRFRCPKNWKRLGGSCYYLSNLTSTSTDANETCHQLHSNRSNLMQIRNTVELFYAAHVLTKNNLSMLMVDIDPDLLKGKTLIADRRPYLY
jgi:hypothetical protein